MNRPGQERLLYVGLELRSGATLGHCRLASGESHAGSTETPCGSGVPVWGACHSTLSCGACLFPSGLQCLPECHKEFGPAVPRADLKKLPYRQVMETEAQPESGTGLGELLEPSQKGSPTVAQVLWVGVSRKCPGA